MPACGSPLLFADCHVLLRRLVPWHPPCALLRLITILRLQLLSSGLLSKIFFATGLLRLALSLCSCQGARQEILPQETLKTIQAWKLTVNSLRHWRFRNFRSFFFLYRVPPIIDLRMKRPCFHFRLLLRKEVIQPHLPIRLPCYDFTPVIDLTLAGWLLAVTSPVSGAINSHGVTGGVYKARERIHRGMLIRDY